MPALWMETEEVSDERNIPVTVRIIRMADGEAVEYADTLYQTDDYDGTFIWSEGNFSCDCNRHSFFQRALNLPEDDDVPCSEGKYMVDWIKDETGKILYSESKI